MHSFAGDQLVEHGRQEKHHRSGCWKTSTSHASRPPHIGLVCNPASGLALLTSKKETMLRPTVSPTPRCSSLQCVRLDAPHTYAMAGGSVILRCYIPPSFLFTRSSDRELFHEFGIVLIKGESIAVGPH